MNGTTLIAAATLGLSVLAVALPAGAQQTETDRRLDRIEKQLRETRSIVFQGRDTGQPVVVKPDGPDPAVTALQARVDDLDQTLRRLSGQVEVASHDSDQTRRTVSTDHDTLIEMRAQLQALTERLAKLEAQLTVAVQPQAQAQPPAVVAPPAVEERRGGRTPRGAAEATARAQAEPGEVLGGPPAAADTEAGAYRRAMDLQGQGDYAAAGQAWQDYIAHYGQGPKGKEARYRLGEALYIQSDYGQAARAYAEALKGWPKTAWAADATVKLSLALSQLGRRDEACSVVGEFDTRYGAAAPTAVKSRAKAARTKAACAAA